MITDVSGVVSFALDGMEGVLTENRLRNLTVESSRQKIPAASMVTGGVAEGTPVFKVVTSNTWHIVSHMDKTETVGWTENTRKTIYVFKNNTHIQLDARVSVIENAGDFSYVVFTMNSRMLDFIDMRSVTFRLETSSAEGLKIPTAAITEMVMLVIPNDCIDGAGRVTVINTNGRQTLIELSVASSDDENSYAALEHNILRFGSVITNNRTGGIYEITEVRMRQGVFLNNTGSSEFRDINTEGSVQSRDGYTILNRALNPHIRVGDNVIADARNVENRQLIY
jgi:hypothetical protein